MLDVFFVLPHDKLFTPGPVEVSAKTLAAFSRPMIGHRGEDFKTFTVMFIQSCKRSSEPDSRCFFRPHQPGA